MPNHPIRVFTETSADARNVNAQSLTVREIFSRLNPERFRVAMTHQTSEVDPKIKQRTNTRLVRGFRHGKAAQYVASCLVFHPDIFFYPQPSPVTDAFLSIRKLLGLRTKLVVHVVTSFGLMRAFEKNGFIENPLTRSIQEADLVVSNSRFVARDLDSTLGIKSKVLHNGIDKRNFYPQEHPRILGDSVRVLYVGSFRRYKRAYVVLEAASIFKDHSFIMVGEGEERDKCEQLAKSLPTSNVTFLSPMSPPQLGDLMRSSDIFLLPSVVEGHPQVLGQAAACGLPCVAMRCYEPDYVVHGETGLLASTDEEFFQFLSHLIKGRDLRKRMGASAADHSKQFDWDAIARQWADIFETVVGRNEAN